MDYQLMVISSTFVLFSSLVQILHLCQASSSVILRKLALFLTQSGPPLIKTTENVTLARNIFSCITLPLLN